jgi:hypothetical protein
VNGNVSVITAGTNHTVMVPNSYMLKSITTHDDKSVNINDELTLMLVITSYTLLVCGEFARLSVSVVKSTLEKIDNLPISVLI